MVSYVRSSSELVLKLGMFFLHVDYMDNMDIEQIVQKAKAINNNIMH